MKKFKGKKVYYESIETKEYQYDGYCAVTGSNAEEPHGPGEAIKRYGNKLQFYNILIGEWRDGVFYKGSLSHPEMKWKHVGLFKNDDLHGKGVEYQAKNKKDFEAEKWIGIVKGTFENGRLIKGEITNPSHSYSELKGLKKIIIKKDTKILKKDTRGINFHVLKGKIYYDNGEIYEGDICFDRPYGKGVMKNSKHKRVLKGIWREGLFYGKE